MFYIRCLYKYKLHYLSLGIEFMFVYIYLFIYICKKEIVFNIICIKLNFSFLNN